MLWEVLGSKNRSRLAVNSKFVFTDIENSIHALDRKTGKTIWSESLGEILETNINYSQDRPKWEFEYGWSRRFIATDEIVIAQGSKGIAARNSDNGKLLWSFKNESEMGDSEPIIFNKLAVFNSVKDCSVFALDLQTGKEVFRILIPECNYFYILDD